MTRAERRWELWDLDLPLDREHYDRIVADMRRHGGGHRPDTPWHDESLFPGSEETQHAPGWHDLLRPWVSQADLATDEDIVSCREFLERHAQGGLLPPRSDAALLPGAEVGIVDLRTMLDVALITSHLDAPWRAGARVLEVGGGYGRLAEAFLRLQPPAARYLMVDAVPASLFYAYAYLSQRLPDRRIGSYYVHGSADPDVFDCFIVPRWHADDLVGRDYDVAVNIASFQEMREDRVEDYLALFDAAVRSGGEIYLCNSRVFAFRRRFTYPRHWELLYESTTPFSYLPYKPVEIFRKGDADYSAANTIVERDYLERLFHEEHARWKALVQENRNLRRTIGRLEARVQELMAERRRLRARGSRYDALAAEVRKLRSKARRYDALAAEARQLQIAARGREALAAEVKELRTKTRSYDALLTQVKQLRGKARRHEALVAEVKELRTKTRRHDALLAEVKDLRGAARRLDALTEEARELRRKARLYDRLVPELKGLRSKARRYDAFALEARVLRSKARRFDALSVTDGDRSPDG